MKEQDLMFQLDANTLRVAGVGLWTYDTTTRVLWYSGFADNIHVANEPLRVDVDAYIAIVDTQDKERVVNYILSLHTATPDAGLQYMIHGNGEDFYLDNRVVSSTPKEGGFIVRGYAQNVTHQVMLEHELKRVLLKDQHSERLKSAFIANVSHEFRTPITAITGFSLLAMQSDDPIEKQEYTAIVEENSARLLRLINTLIHLSELQVGSYKFRYYSFSLSCLIDRLITDTKAQCPNSVKTTNQTHDQMCAAEIVSDESAVSVVFSNLLKNALKYTSVGEISLGYSIDATTSCVTCFVKDTGTGITPEQQAKIFEPFYQSNTFDDGVGLGLPLCKLIVHELGGSIWVESEPEVGTTIYFTLPNQESA